MSRSQGEASGRRGPGTRVGLTVKQIVAAARRMPPELLTMQAVADELDVNRKAVSYYVSDRESLLGLVASDALAESMASWTIPADADWKDACRSFAVTMKENIIATGNLAGYVRLTALDRAALMPGEIVVEKLLEAGFSERTAAVGISLLADLSMSFAQSAVLERRTGVHPQVAEVRRVLDQADPAGLEALRRIANTPDSDPDDRFATYVDVYVLGMEQLLLRA